MQRNRTWLVGLAVLLAALALYVLATATPERLPAAAPFGPSPFSGELHLVLLQDKAHASTRAGRSLWAVEKPLSYRTHAGDTITLPPGMVTDLASIPAPVSALLPPDGPWAQIAVFHDLLYVTRGTGVWHGHRSLSRDAPYTRAEADALLRDGMGDLGISGWRQVSIYAGVRLGGAAGWGR
jgi:hypothetical protein